MQFTRAIVRPPAANFADGLTSVDLGRPCLATTLAQHQRYCEVLETCGLELLRLPEDPQHADSTFVEDTAILTARGAILMRPGAPSRMGEVASIGAVLQTFYPDIALIEAPGTVDGGDICEADGHVFIGLSQRTNEAGAEQLAGWLKRRGYTSSCIDIRATAGILHLKSGIAWLGDGHMVVGEVLGDRSAFRDYEIIPVDIDNTYAANCIRVNDVVLISSGFPAFEATLGRLGYATLALDMSEYRKMDGGLSCLSLRF